jgi:hypothetical protein
MSGINPGDEASLPNSPEKGKLNCVVMHSLTDFAETRIRVFRGSLGCVDF